MSLATNVTDLAIRTGTELKALRTLLNGNAADLSSLSTTAKGNLVAAINELYAAVATASGIDDAQESNSTSWSSSKTRTEITAAEARAVDAAVDDAGTSTTSAWSSSNTQTKIGQAVAGLIDDSTPSASKVYSSTKTQAQIAAAVAALVDSAPGDLDTLRELAEELQSESSAIAALNTALGNRVRFDAAQTLTAPQAQQARDNIGAASAAALAGLATNVGDTTTNYVTSLEAALL